MVHIFTNVRCRRWSGHWGCQRSPQRNDPYDEHNHERDHSNPVPPMEERTHPMLRNRVGHFLNEGIRKQPDRSSVGTRLPLKQTITL